jgi:CRP-like cAMP-binding protein
MRTNQWREPLPNHVRSLGISQKGPEIEGNEIKNALLLDLPSGECQTLFSYLTLVPIRAREVLQESGEPIKYAYFINRGLASVLNAMTDGKTVEVGLVGKEGCTALPVVAGFHTSNEHIICQVDGDAFRVSIQSLTGMIRKCPVLERRMQQFGFLMGVQSAQIAACNSLHDVEERFARWLLMTQDRIGGNVIPLTHEFLAHMLGTRRSSVTVAAGLLQKSGHITYNRGSVRIENRQRLEDAACECYNMIRDQTEVWRREAGLPFNG